MRPEAECSPSLDTMQRRAAAALHPGCPSRQARGWHLWMAHARAVCSDSGMAPMAGLGRSHAKQQDDPRWHEQQTVRARAIATRGVGALASTVSVSLRNKTDRDQTLPVFCSSTARQRQRGSASGGGKLPTSHMHTPPPRLTTAPPAAPVWTLVPKVPEMDRLLARAAGWGRPAVLRAELQAGHRARAGPCSMVRLCVLARIALLPRRLTVG